MGEMEGLIAEWEGLAVITRFDRPTGTWIFIALHNASLGPPLGGCRMRVYPAPAEGLRDALRLAEGMTHKWAVLDLGYGGGKSVLAVPRVLEGEERIGLFRRFGRFLEMLGGAYSTGVDLGTTPADMAVLAQETRFVHGFDRTTGRAIDPGPYTAHGVVLGIRTAIEQVFGSVEWRQRTVLVEGLGDVGRPLVRLLADAGATVLVSDIVPERVQEMSSSLPCVPIPPELVYDTSCDVYAPCAIGGTLNEQTVPRLRCRIVAGSANNQLEHPAIADLLHERGILYAPDYVVNAGGAIALPLFHRGAREGEVRMRIEGIGDTLRQLFSEAARTGESPLHAARRRVERVLGKHASRAEPAGT